MLAFRLLKSANLSLANVQLVKATIGDLSYFKMKRILKNIFSSSSEIKSEVKDEIKVEETNVTLYANQPYGGFQRGGSAYNPSGYQSRAASRPYRGFRIPYRPTTRGRGNRMLSGSNPPDQFGNISTCASCGSRNHWIAKCPDKKDNATYFEEETSDTYDETFLPETEDQYQNVVLFQSDYDSPNCFKSLVAESFGCAVIDCGASQTVCGKTWYMCYLETLDKVSRDAIVTKPSDNSFKFGDGRRVTSTGCVDLPAKIGNCDVTIKTDIVNEDIPLLLSKSSLKKSKSDINFYDNTIQILGQKLRLFETQTGHYILPIKKEKAIIEAIDCDMGETCTLVCQTEMTPKEKAIKLHRQFAHPSVNKIMK